MTSLEKTGKTIEEAIEAALTELSVTRDEVDIEILETPSKGLFGLIGGKPARVRLQVKQLPPVNKKESEINPLDTAKMFLNNIFAVMKMDVAIEATIVEDHNVLNLRGDDLGVLIGKHGQTLDALQYLTNLTANKDTENRIRIILDVEDYRKRREDTLSQLALRLADKVKRRGDKVALEPMSSHERKIIHSALQNDNRIVTYSEGDEPFRKVVIALKR